MGFWDDPAQSAHIYAHAVYQYPNEYSHYSPSINSQKCKDKCGKFYTETDKDLYKLYKSCIDKCIPEYK